MRLTPPTPIPWSTVVRLAGRDDLGWTPHFDPPVPMAAADLITLADARNYILSLPITMQEFDDWQVAAEILLNAAEFGGSEWIKLARAGMVQAIDHEHR